MLGLLNKCAFVKRSAQEEVSLLVPVKRLPTFIDNIPVKSKQKTNNVLKHGAGFLVVPQCRLTMGAGIIWLMQTRMCKIIPFIPICLNLAFDKWRRVITPRRNVAFLSPKVPLLQKEAQNTRFHDFCWALTRQQNLQNFDNVNVQD